MGTFYRRGDMDVRCAECGKVVDSCQILRMIDASTQARAEMCDDCYEEFKKKGEPYVKVRVELPSWRGE